MPSVFSFNVYFCFYVYSVGRNILYFNLTTFLGGEGMVKSAGYNKTDIVRAAAVANKFKVMTFVLNHVHNDTSVQVTLEGHSGNENDTKKVG